MQLPISPQVKSFFLLNSWLSKMILIPFRILISLSKYFCFLTENLIGEGGCSYVFKGHLPCGRSVAVKILKSYKEAWIDFYSEMNIISTLKHKHITSLIGVCVEDNFLISVYDFFPMGSLEENLHGNLQ